jgi:hypothetical protein
MFRPITGVTDQATAQATVVAETMYCSASPDVPSCLELVSYQHPCGHSIKDVHCSKAFGWTDEPNDAPSCEELVEIVSPLCGHGIRLPCFKVAVMRQWAPWGEGGKGGEGGERGEGGEGGKGRDNRGEGGERGERRTIADCDAHGEIITHIVVCHDCSEPLPLPQKVTMGEMTCDGSAALVRGQFSQP